MIGKKNYEFIYTDPFLIKTTGGHTPHVTIGSNIIKRFEEKEKEESSD